MAAQAARLSLRMQKELKLLIADPPPGASFPRLSDDSSVLCLSSIDAQIKGPEGTVYENGVFNVEIQIPDRYPFQPPSVTFATPIYHPNIDPGGRICLDILNLPPKGAWQPSLNVSTVLMSIGLLLSEPNPDDGLMFEASREYKYNRQVFDQKARSITEKYAYPGASEGSCMKATSTEDELKPEADKHVLGLNNIGVTRFNRKLTLESSTSSQENVASNNQHLVDHSDDHSEVEGAQKELKRTIETPNWSREKRKLSLESSSQSLKRSSNGMEDRGSLTPLMPQDSDRPVKDLRPFQENIFEDESINAKSKTLRGIFPTQPFGSSDRTDVIEKKNLKNPEASRSNEKKASMATNAIWLKPLVEKSVKEGNENVPCGASLKKLCFGGKRLSLGLRGSSVACNKENINPIEVASGKNKVCEDHGNLAQLQTSNDFVKKPVSDKDRSGSIAGGIENQEAEESVMSELVIVLDSEDSDEEDKSVLLRSKPMLTRKRLGKWKLKSVMKDQNE